MASTRFLAASNSPRSMRITQRAPTASHISGIIIALCAEEAARIAMLKPLVGNPAFAKSLALRVSSLMRRTMSAKGQSPSGVHRAVFSYLHCLQSLLQLLAFRYNRTHWTAFLAASEVQSRVRMFRISRLHRLFVLSASADEEILRRRRIRC